MDNIHHPDKRAWISEEIELSSYFQKYKEELKNVGSKKISEDENKTTNFIRRRRMIELIGISNLGDKDSTYDRLEEACSLSELSIPGEMEPCQYGGNDTEIPKFKNDKEIPPDAANHLKTIALQKMFRETGKTRDLKYNCNNWFEAMAKEESLSKSRPLSSNILEKEILTVVRVYRPVKNQGSDYGGASKTKSKHTQEIHLLGSNKLTELRDHIKCHLDFQTSEDLSDDPNNELPRKIGKEKYKSGFLYINGCFYNDMRWPECIDYSQTIREWADKPSRKIGPFTTANMEKTLIKDLTIRIGYPYVYVHQGEHEHLFSFIDVRLVSSFDSQKISSYPLDRSTGLKQGKYCMICSFHLAKWITTNNDRVPEDPFYFCDSCFYGFNYGDDGTKLSNFSAKRFLDLNVI